MNTMLEIFVCDVKFDVDVYFTKARRATHLEPAEPAEAVVEGIYLDGHEVSEILAQWVIDRIKESAEERRPSEEEDGDYLYQQRRDAKLERMAA